MLVVLQLYQSTLSVVFKWFCNLLSNRLSHEIKFKLLVFFYPVQMGLKQTLLLAHVVDELRLEKDAFLFFLYCFYFERIPHLCNKIRTCGWETDGCFLSTRSGRIPKSTPLFGMNSDRPDTRGEFWHLEKKLSTLFWVLGSKMAVWVCALGRNGAGFMGGVHKKYWVLSPGSLLSSAKHS